MISWLRYGKPRRYVLKLARFLPAGSRVREQLLDWLYPSDCRITFK